MHNQHGQWVKDALDVASKSHVKTKHGCIIIDSHGSIVSTGCNRYEGVQNIYKPYRRGERLSCHAEEMALRSADPRRLMGAKLYVVRVSHDHTPMNSKPCNRCTILIEKYMCKYGLKKVYYSEGVKGNLEEKL